MRGWPWVPAAKAAEWTALAAIPIITAIRLQFSPNTDPKFLSEFLLNALHGWYAVVVGVLSLAGLSGRLLQNFLRAERRTRIKAVVDTLAEACFRDVPDEDRWENRATLFRANWLETKLKVYCRSGTQYQHRRPTLKIHDSDQPRNEGVGGQAWFRNTTVVAENLPDCTLPCRHDIPACREYAERGFMSILRARDLKVRSRSVLATPVRDAKGKKWGVLVIDTRRPDPFSLHQREFTTAFAAALGKMVS